MHSGQDARPLQHELAHSYLELLLTFSSMTTWKWNKCNDFVGFSLIYCKLYMKYTDYYPSVNSWPLIQTRTVQNV